MRKTDNHTKVNETSVNTLPSRLPLARTAIGTGNYSNKTHKHSVLLAVNGSGSAYPMGCV